MCAWIIHTSGVLAQQFHICENKYYVMECVFYLCSGIVFTKRSNFFEAAR